MGRGSNFGMLLGKGRRDESEFFRLVWAPNGRGHARFAFIISRIVDLRSSARHRLRRLAHARIMAHRDILFLPYDIAIVFKKAAGSAARAVLAKEFDGAFGRLLGRASDMPRVSKNHIS